MFSLSYGFMGTVDQILFAAAIGNFFAMNLRRSFDKLRINSGSALPHV
jgi:hypothetical protein